MCMYYICTFNMISKSTTIACTHSVAVMCEWLVGSSDACCHFSRIYNFISVFSAIFTTFIMLINYNMERNEFRYRFGKLPSASLIINASPPSIKLGMRCLNDMVRFLYFVIFLNSQCSPKVTKMLRLCVGESV